MLHNWREQYKENESKMAKDLADSINNYSCSLKGNAEYLANFEHRYLQNEAFKFAMLYIQEMANNYDNDHYDGRNEYACAMAKHITELLEEHPLIHNYRY